MPDDPRDHYEILGLPRNATPDQIEAAYRRRLHEVHPDRPDGDEEEFAKVSEAHRVLSSPRSRRDYDGTLPPEAGTGSVSGMTYSTASFKPAPEEEISEEGEEWGGDLPAEITSTDLGDDESASSQDSTRLSEEAWQKAAAESHIEFDSEGNAVKSGTSAERIVRSRLWKHGQARKQGDIDRPLSRKVILFSALAAVVAAASGWTGWHFFQKHHAFKKGKTLSGAHQTTAFAPNAVFDSLCAQMEREFGLKVTVKDSHAKPTKAEIKKMASATVQDEYAAIETCTEPPALREYNAQHTSGQVAVDPSFFVPYDTAIDQSFGASTNKDLPTGQEANGWSPFTRAPYLAIVVVSNETNFGGRNVYLGQMNSDNTITPEDAKRVQLVGYFKSASASKLKFGKARSISSVESSVPAELRDKLPWISDAPCTSVDFTGGGSKPAVSYQSSWTYVDERCSPTTLVDQNTSIVAPYSDNILRTDRIRHDPGYERLPANGVYLAQVVPVLAPATAYSNAAQYALSIGASIQIGTDDSGNYSVKSPLITRGAMTGSTIPSTLGDVYKTLVTNCVTYAKLPLSQQDGIC